MWLACALANLLFFTGAWAVTLEFFCSLSDLLLMSLNFTECCSTSFTFMMVQFAWDDKFQFEM